MTFDYEIDGLKIAAASIDPTPPIITIKDGPGVTFEVQNLFFNVTADYSFVSDPPIFADIGQANFVLSPTTIRSDVTSYFHRGI